MDEKKLLKYAVDYLSKYDSSKNNLVNVLKRKILRLNVTNFEKKKTHWYYWKYNFKIRKK